ncbi:hypothetical protein Gpo141_00014346, partial [Globisporangium polare]
MVATMILDMRRVLDAHASDHENPWLFEINPSVKWFYDWEVGAARDRRTMPHVFEAYVFHKASSSQSAAPTETATGAYGVLPDSAETLEVVALVASSPFTLISFRHAPTARHARVIVKHSSDYQKQTHSPLPQDMNSDRLDAAIAAASLRDRDVIARGETYFRLSELFEQRSDVDLQMDVDALRTHEGQDDPEMEADEQDGTSCESSTSRIASAARSTMTANQFMHRISLRATMPFARAIERKLSAVLRERLETSFIGR